MNTDYRHSFPQKYGQNGPRFRQSRVGTTPATTPNSTSGGVIRAGSGARFFQFKDAFGDQFHRLAQALGVHHDIAAGHVAAGAVVQ